MIGADVRWIGLLIALAFTVAGCGVGGPSSTPRTSTSGSPVTSPDIPSVRALVPADLEGDGRPDAVPHPSLQRLLVQAPAGTGFRLLRGNIDVPFAVTMLSLSDGTTLHELVLERPVGTQPLTLRAGPNYQLTLQADSQLGTQQPLIARPVTPGALTNDLANPTGALYPGASDVSFCLSGAIPSLASGGLVLRSGLGRAQELLLSIGPDGLRARPAAALEARRVYALEATGVTTDPYGRKPAPTFRLICRGAATEKEAIKLRLADLNRDGESELVCLFSDGAVTSITDVGGKAEGILPKSDETAHDFTVGDFDGNGALDLIVLMQGKTGFRLLTVYNLTRIGVARFTVQSDEIPLSAPIAIRAADFDRDGRDDYAVLDAFGEVLVQFSARPAQRVQGLADGALACALLTDDATGDGKPDLYVMAADGRGRLLPNINGSGFNTEIGVLELGAAGAQRVIGCDLDGDRSADFIFSGRQREISMVQQLKTYPYALAGDTDRLAGAVVCRDINRDSRQDILVVREDDRGIGDEVAVYLNREGADGSPDAILQAGFRVRVEAIEYWHEHIFFATSAGLALLKIDASALPPTVDSDVRFIEAYQPVPQIPAPLAAAMADFNDDGKGDLAALDRDGNLQIWLSGVQGEPFTPAGEPIALGVGGTLQAIDFDRDSAPDLLYIPSDPSQRPRVLRNGRDGRFSDDDQGLLPTPPSTLRGAPALGDFDRDGDLDVLWPSPLGRVQFNEGRDGWRDCAAVLDIRQDSMRLQFSGELCCADFTGDGIADVAAVMQIGEEALEQYLVLLEGTGSADDRVGPFRVTISTAIRGRMFGLSPADFNGDGRLDLALGFGTSEPEMRLTLLRLGATRQFEAFEGSPAAKGRVLDLALDDLDRDGDLDLIVSEDIAEGGSTMTLWVNDGNGRFGQATDAQASLSAAIGGFRATNLSLSDFTGDGRPDLMAIDRDGNVVIVRTTLP